MAKSRQVWGGWKPDVSPFMSDGLVTAEGVYASVNGYKPIGQFLAFADSPTGTFNGGAGFVNSLGATVVLAGNTTKLYVKSGTSWTLISTPAAFNGRWHFTQFGDKAVCVNGGAVLKVNLLTNAVASLGGSPPTAELCCTLRDFVVLGRTGSDYAKVTWSGFNDAESWTSGTNLSGYQPMQAGGKIVGLVGGEFGLILQRYRIVRMSFTGDGNAPFQFDEISQTGCRSEGSIAQAGRLTWYLSDRGFCETDGVTVTQVGNELFNRTFLASYSDGEIQAMWATTDPIRSLVIWAIGNKLWIYNWDLQRMTTATMTVTGLMPAFSDGLTLDGLDAVYTNLDNIGFSLDDDRLKGGYPKLTVVNGSGAFGTLESTSMAATITGPIVEYIDGREGRIRYLHPICDATSGISITVNSLATLGATPVASAASALNARGDMHVRSRGRYHQITQQIAAGTTWSYSEGVDVDLEAGGAR